MNFLDRIDRLDRMTKYCKLRGSFPLLKEVCFNYHLYEKLYNAVNFYIYHCVSAYKICPNTYKYLNSYNSETLLNLPNRTPNGLVLPKRQNFLAYNHIHSCVKDILEDAGVAEHLDSLHTPLCIRLIKGVRSEVDNRPKASTKLHSDVWTGHATNTTIMFLPIHGNFLRNGISFYEPVPDEFKDYIRILENYDEGAWLKNNAKKYNINIDTGYLYLADAYLLHHTNKGDNSIRISIDFNTKSKYKSNSDLPLEASREDNYLSYAQWREIGTTKLLYSDLDIGEYRQREADKYAGEYKVVDL